MNIRLYINDIFKKIGSGDIALQNEKKNQLSHTNKLDNLDEMEKFLQTHKCPKLIKIELENLKRFLKLKG